jgi:hypothetical protein
LALRIQGRGSFSQNEDVRPMQEYTRKGQPLLFTSREDLVSRLVVFEVID